jgi:hypothetical protein
MPIARHDEETSVHELIGACCERLVAAPGGAVDLVVALYILVNGAWYRFFVDAGCLVLYECAAPDAAVGLAGGEEYVDLGEVLGCAGKTIVKFEMRAGTLTIGFSGGESLVVSEGASGGGGGPRVRLLN